MSKSDKDPNGCVYLMEQPEAIARKFNVSPVELLSLNNMSRNTALRPGDTVRVAVN